MSESKSPEEGQNEVQRDEDLSEQERERRKLLKRAVLGSGVVATSPVWVRPVVKTVVLPAHAQASMPTSTTTPGATTTTFTSTTIPEE